jgi:hypothetical protein
MHIREGFHYAFADGYKDLLVEISNSKTELGGGVEIGSEFCTGKSCL